MSKEENSPSLRSQISVFLARVQAILVPCGNPLVIATVHLESSSVLRPFSFCWFTEGSLWVFLNLVAASLGRQIKEQRLWVTCYDWRSCGHAIAWDEDGDMTCDGALVQASRRPSAVLFRPKRRRHLCVPLVCDDLDATSLMMFTVVCPTALF